MKRFSITLTAAILLLSGCTVLSFYPFFTKDVLIRDDRLTGVWNTYNNSEITWEINFPDSVIEATAETQWNEKKVKNKFTYLLKCFAKDEPGDTATFKIHLFKLKDQLFLDFCPEDWEIKNEMLSFHLMAAHTVAKVELNDTLNVNWMEPEWFDELIRKNKIRIHHEKNDHYTLLTAKSEELKNFISKYASDTVAWKDGVEYSLCKRDEQ